MAKFLPPEGYLFDKNTGLYYSQVIAKNQEGITCQIVTWFHPETGEYSRNIYPVSGAVVSKEQNAPVKKEKGTFVAKKAINRTRRKNANPLIQYMLMGSISILLGIILVGNVMLAVKRQANNEKRLMESVADLLNAESQDSMLNNTDMEKTETSKEATYSIDGDYSTVWRDTTERGFIGIHYMTVGQDDEYVYTLKAEGQSWYETDNIPYGALVRFKKTDIYHVETIVPEDDPIIAFAIMGDYIYYGQLTSDGSCEYTRKNKNTGEEVFLLSEDYSLLAADNGLLYFLFAENDRNQLGMFDVTTGEMTYKDIDYDFPTAIEESGNYSLFAPFGLYAGCLCLGGHIGDNTIFWAMVDLNSDEIIYARGKNKFMGASLSTDEASEETARYYRRYGMGAMLAPGEKNPYRVAEMESNGHIKMFNYFADMSPKLVDVLDQFGKPESQRFNRLELSFYDIFTGDRPTTGKYGHGFTLKLDQYPQMALSFDNFPTGITRDFYIYNHYIVRIVDSNITEIAEY